jgi:uncharacterized coiled-coil protein SlyX
MTRSLTGNSSMFSRLEKHLALRDRTIKQYRKLLVSMERSVKAAGDGRFFTYPGMEKELIQRLDALQKVIDPLQAQLSPSPLQERTIRTFNDDFEAQRKDVLFRHRQCRKLLEQEMRLLKKRISSLRAMPARPPAFSRVEEPSRLDISG